MNATSPLQLALEAALSPGCVTTDPDRLLAYAHDWSDAPPCPPTLLVRPRTPTEVARALALCNQHRQAVVVQGGLTGLAGGATPVPGEVALSLDRLNQIETVDTVGGTATVQAGVVLEALQQAAATHGWSFPLDLGARGSCQVGGNAATNAGGNRVVRYGTMRDLVLGLEVALPDGRLLNLMNHATKNTTGTDVKQLFIGSEGTLGVITRLVLKLSPQPTVSHTALCALPSFEAATTLLRSLRQDLAGLSAFELMWGGFVDAALLVAPHLRPPFAGRHPLCALVETQGAANADGSSPLQTSLEQALEHGVVSDVVFAQSLQEQTALWAYRETVGEMLGRYKPHAAFDVGIPMAEMGRFVAEVEAALQARFPTQTHLFFGHLGDDNLHVLSGPYADEATLLAVETLVYETVGRFGGAVSGEHGIGAVKRPFLHLSRSPEVLAVMRDLKQLFDPTGVLNPGRVLA